MSVLKEAKLWAPPELMNNSTFAPLKSFIESKIRSNGESSKDVILDWLKWCEKQVNRVKVIDHNIPNGVLPDKFNGCIHDIKVQGKRRCPDDTMYNKYADLR